MTRVNVIPPELLLDQHLMAEYREIPMVPAALRRSLAAKTFPKIPKEYTLNSGHVKFFYLRRDYIETRYRSLIAELKNRGFQLDDDRKTNFEVFDKVRNIEWVPDQRAININMERIFLRYLDKPTWYKYRGKNINYEEFLNEKIKI